MKDKVLAVLKEPIIKSINFTLPNTIPMNGSDFESVIEAIEDGTINVVEDGSLLNVAKYTAQDDGDSKANTMYIGKNTSSTVVFNSLLLHESVHAIYDLKRMSIPWMDNEVIAYVTQGFYLKKHGYTGGLSEEADLGRKIAVDFEVQAADPFFLDILKDTLKNSPIYQTYICKTFVGDG